MENHPASRPSSEGVAVALSRCGEACLDRGFKSVLFRGDTAYTQTEHLDGWDEKGHCFVFGMMAHPKVVGLANGLDEGAYRRLERQNPEAGDRRSRPQNHRQLVIQAKALRNLELEQVHVAEIRYKPKKSKKTYRLVIQRKRLKITKGQRLLEPEIRYFFFLSNLPKETHNAFQIIAESNQRCNQENLIEQLKNEVQAMRMPTKSFLANWTYVVICAIASNLKSWLALAVPKARRDYFARCDFNAFHRDIILLPAQILRTGRKTVFRLLGYKNSVPWLLDAFHAIK